MISCWVMVEAALRRTAGKVGDQRADDALDIDAVMLVKACVLDGDEGVLQHIGNLVDRNHDAVFRTLVIGDEIAVAVINKRSLILRIERGEVERRRGIDESLGDADDRAQQSKRSAERKNEGKTEGRRCDAQHEIRVLCPRFEDGMGARMNGALARSRSRLLLLCVGSGMRRVSR